MNSDVFLSDVIRGLNAPQKFLSSKYFYDAAGSKLFQEITQLPEYYLTRTEIGIIKDNLSGIAAAVGPDAIVIEPGAGASEKIQLFLHALHHPIGFVPIDISPEILHECADTISTEFPEIDVFPITADFQQKQIAKINRDLSKEFSREGNNRVVFFPGSTIGNFNENEAVELLQSFHDVVGPGGKLILGADLVKDPAVLTAAYNDSQGVTAAFNLNVLKRIVSTFNCEIVLEAFRHRAEFNARLSRVEMHLESTISQSILIEGQEFHFEKGETIHTENSYKYTPESLRSILEKSQFTLAETWTDDRQYFGLFEFIAT